MEKQRNSEFIQVSIITSIKPQKNLSAQADKKRVSIYFDGKFGFGLDLENYLRFGLKVGRELTEEEIEKIVNQAEFQKVYNKLLKFASLRPRSEKEYKFWLKRHKAHQSLHKELFNRLKRLGFLDDRKFAVWWIDQRTTFRPRSIKALRSELGFKGIGRQIIDELLSEMNVGEEKAAQKLVEKNKYKWEKLDEFNARRKMTEFLLRRGFKWEVIKKSLDEF
ncbi:hypothetical protein A2686_03530 [Candidatus Woesebacteria bacterium RIFCSPHIGHO2_01_FULL_38_10]|uniref:Regulatory protein RecX n=1 Tax=Candidatus Woesebacteria bacterium RIFCSPLOWO2_01_FULL_39_10b TaxID=1802517 RepID=A0A1F8B7J0_9BACT|nr:MAG: hypothetical protein A2686_03530 [Candidatus Woesebacteria bacterium RIFCSPHIGHO2_01_FULL_38_10]OGM59669.1 MAG: hypothetical protein A2892_04045 [Candidatus Woesebacteria bacterium RIFCSPLOWO2_01_FULL_39_10b]